MEEKNTTNGTKYINPLCPYKMPHVISRFTSTALSIANDYAHHRPQPVTKMWAHKQK